MTAQDENVHLSIHLDLTIRQLRQADLRNLEWFGQFLHYRRLFLRSFYGQREGNRYLMVADVNNFPIGRLFIQFGKQKSQLSDGVRRAYLYSFQVMEIFQGQGIGTELIHTAESYLLRRGFRFATISVAKANPRALKLYQREGYTIFAESEGHWNYPDHRGIVREVHEPCWLLEKTLELN